MLPISRLARRRMAAALAIPFLLTTAACGGDDKADSAPTTQPGQSDANSSASGQSDSSASGPSTNEAIKVVSDFEERLNDLPAADLCSAATADFIDQLQQENQPDLTIGTGCTDTMSFMQSNYFVGMLDVSYDAVDNGDGSVEVTATDKFASRVYTVVKSGDFTQIDSRVAVTTEG